MHWYDTPENTRAGNSSDEVCSEILSAWTYEDIGLLVVKILLHCFTFVIFIVENCTSYAFVI